jgi:hypothetical protein
MRLTIICEDGAVYKDGVSYSGLDLAAIPSDVHALQFNTTSNAGWIEFTQDDFGDKAANEKITSLPAWATTAMAKWDDAKVAEEAAIVAAAEYAAAHQPVTTGVQTA